MSDDLLTRMAATGYGPVTLTDAGDGRFTATVADGREVSVTSDDRALCFQTAASVRWPADSGRGRSYDPIATALEELAHTHRPELVTIDGGPGTDLTISLWIPLDGATPDVVARSVYSVARIAMLAVATIADNLSLLEMVEPAVAEAAPLPPPPPPDTP